jgi:O-antigen biosynthesis protein WbqP
MIYKFRSMYTDAPKDVPTHLLENPAAFITPVGRFLRKSSLDELPQLFNILKGELTLVGPRPALWNQDDLVAEREKYGANALVPGLTGLAQVKGRDELPIPVKARYDGEYCERLSLMLDIKILFMTFFAVFRSSGVVEGGTGALEKRDDEVEP